VPLERFIHARLAYPARRLEDTGDAVQQVLTSAFRAVDRFEYRSAGSFWVYLRQIAHNHLIKASQREAGRRRVDLPEESAIAPPARGPAPIESLIGREEAEIFEKALLRLRERERQAVLLRIEARFTDREVAEECGYPTPAAAGMAIRRALRRLAKEISGEQPGA
jgi:RNA polymerase sigma factor (sigma-70 family)